MYETVQFQSGELTLRGREYRHRNEDTPWVVMTHGTSATISMVVDAYAERIHDAGFNVLLFDHANFGISGGETRQQINPWVQARGYRDAVNFLRVRSVIGEIALWGDSYSAMIVLVAGAMIPGVSAIVAQIPACGVTLPDLQPSKEQFLKMKSIFDDGDVSGGPEHTLGPLPVVSPDPVRAPSILTPIQAFRWFTEYGGRHGSHWQNQATRVVPPTEVPFNPYISAAHIKAPVLMMIGQDDEMIHCNPDVQKAVFDQIESPKSFYEIAGGHFGLLWHPGKLFDEAVEYQINFLQCYVPGTT